MKRLTYIAACATAIVASAVSAASPSQDFIGLEMANLSVSGSLEDSMGAPITSEVKLILKCGGYSASVYVDPDTSGSFSFDMDYAKTCLQSYDVHVTVVANPSEGHDNVAAGFFLTPADGLAAFSAPSPAAADVNNPNHFGLSVGALVVSTPPLYGTITRLASSTTGEVLKVFDYSPAAAEMGDVRTFAVGRVVPAGSASIPVYRWSRSSFSHIMLEGPNGAFLDSTLLRIGGTAQLEPVAETEVVIDFDESSLPSYFKAYVIPSSEHDPANSFPLGTSERTASTQRACARFGWTLETDGQGIVSRSACFGGTDYVVEIWAPNTAGAPFSSYELVAYKAFGTGSNPLTVTVD